MTWRNLRTPICEDLGIEYPIFSVGFGSATGPELAAAVSNAGGFGALGASGMPVDEIARRITSTR
jgi:NAD(P)H-dependent flavin oxidoreductase YrpB (nitropropane dioxygenase family)